MLTEYDPWVIAEIHSHQVFCWYDLITLLFYLFMVVCHSNFQKANFKFQFQEKKTIA